MGYHKAKIEKGIIGHFSKIKEEFEELDDAINQGAKIMIQCELADLYGAIKWYAANFGLSMSDLEEMNDLTESAFKDGSRK